MTVNSLLLLLQFQSDWHSSLRALWQAVRQAAHCHRGDLRLCRRVSRWCEQSSTTTGSNMVWPWSDPHPQINSDGGPRLLLPRTPKHTGTCGQAKGGWAETTRKCCLTGVFYTLHPSFVFFIIERISSAANNSDYLLTCGTCKICWLFPFF